MNVANIVVAYSDFKKYTEKIKKNKLENQKNNIVDLKNITIQDKNKIEKNKKIK